MDGPGVSTGSPARMEGQVWKRQRRHPGREQNDLEEAEEDWVQDASGPHTCTLIFLHSCCGAPRHVQGLLQDLKFPLDGLRVVAPCAPKRPSGIPEWGDSFQWFEYSTDQLRFGQGTQDDAVVHQLREQRLRLIELLAIELDRLPPDGRMVLGGVSQGASMALDLLLHSCRPPSCKLKGVLSQRGMLQRETLDDLRQSCPMSPTASLENILVLATHGVEDELVPIGHAIASYEHLQDFGVSVVFSAHPGLNHSGYDDAESDAIAQFMKRMVCA